jgi:hypothetical protein
MRLSIAGVTLHDIGHNLGTSIFVLYCPRPIAVGFQIDPKFLF